MSRTGTIPSKGFEQRPRELLTNYEAQADFTINGVATVTDDTSIFKTGNGSVKVVVPADGTVTVDAVVSVDLVTRRIGVWVYVEDHQYFLNTGGVTVYLASTTWTDYVAKSFVFDHSGWNYIQLDKDIWGPGVGNMDFSAIITTRLTLKANATGAATIYLDSLYANGYSRPKCMVTFDDGNVQQTASAAIMEARGIPGTFYIIKSLIDSDSGVVWLESSDLDALHAAGHALCTHGNTNYATLTQAQIEADFEDNRSFVAQWSGNDSYHLAYPYGVYEVDSTDTTVQDALDAAGALSARSTSRKSVFVETLSDSDSDGIAHPRHMRVAGYWNADATSVHKDYIDRAIQQGSSIILMFHRMTDTPDNSIDITVANFTDIMDHIKLRMDQGLLDTMTVPEFYKQASSAKIYRS